MAIQVERRLQEIDERLAKGEGVWLAADGPIVAAGPALLYAPDLPVEAPAPTPVGFRTAEDLSTLPADSP